MQNKIQEQIDVDTENILTKQESLKPFKLKHKIKYCLEYDIIYKCIDVTF